MPAITLAAEPIGRLFFSPAERVGSNQQLVASPPPAAPPRLDGIITRSAGNPTLFLDGQATAAHPGQVRMGDATARVAARDGRWHRLRVGDPPPR
ncbi:hypothetical protein [Zoogloea sp.]|uniref:hypothetical protein n=1 Tax=Zoogloea sp. TaxID=49181 RepID=UPI001AC2977F|nr:hypothetical protein [Zoogloea sp.]MBN8283098.1 hypothetical protein [Zoogloea sp.]